MFKFEKYQSAIFGPISSDSVTNIEKKFEKKHLPGFVWVLLKKPAKKVEFRSKQDKFYLNFGHFNKKKSFLYLNKN